MKSMPKSDLAKLHEYQSKPLIELNEMLERQEKLLQNK